MNDCLDERLMLACIGNPPDPYLVGVLISMGGDVNCRRRLSNFEKDLTPLFRVVMHCDLDEGRAARLEIAQLLLDAGADPDLVCHPYYNTPVTARELAQEHCGEIFAMIERRDLGPPAKPGKAKSI